MRIFFQAVNASAIIALAACSGGGSQLPTGSPAGSGGLTQQSHIMGGARFGHGMLAAATASTKTRVKQHQFVNVAGINAAGGNQTIVSDYINSAVYIYGGGGNLNATLTSRILNPQGLVIDAAQTLYVANTGKSNVLIFRKPYTNSTRLNDPGQYPAGIALDKAGNIGLTNIYSTSGGPGSVSFYRKGASSPCVTISDPNWARVYFGAFDASGNFYIDGQDFRGNTLLGVVSGECSATAIQPLTAANTILFPGGVALSGGNILYTDQIASTVYTYVPPSDGSLGSPIATTVMSGAADPVTIAIMKHGQNLWEADATGRLNAAKYAYTAGGSAIKTIVGSFAEPIGIAVNPVEKPI